MCTSFVIQSTAAGFDDGASARSPTEPVNPEHAHFTVFRHRHRREPPPGLKAVRPRLRLRALRLDPRTPCSRARDQPEAPEPTPKGDLTDPAPSGMTSNTAARYVSGAHPRLYPLDPIAPGQEALPLLVSKA
jgi:hypothetical protein